jgi:hypothetical protein
MSGIARTSVFTNRNTTKNIWGNNILVLAFSQNLVRNLSSLTLFPHRGLSRRHTAVGTAPSMAIGTLERPLGAPPSPPGIPRWLRSAGDPLSVSCKEQLSHTKKTYLLTRELFAHRAAPCRLQELRYACDWTRPSPLVCISQSAYLTCTIAYRLQSHCARRCVSRTCWRMPWHTHGRLACIATAGPVMD